MRAVSGGHPARWPADPGCNGSGTSSFRGLWLVRPAGVSFPSWPPGPHTAREERRFPNGHERALRPGHHWRLFMATDVDHLA